jgi:hypothetical protein
MRIFFNIFVPLLIVAYACQRKAPLEDPAAWNKIKIDFKRLDKEGLAGPEGGKVALHYEYCIPQNEKYWKRIQMIDRSATRPGAGQGRVGCTSGQWLIFGTTHQKNYQRVLFELASLPCVTRIEEVFWE